MEEEELYIDLFDRHYHKEIGHAQMVLLYEETGGSIDLNDQFGYYEKALNILELNYIKAIMQEAISA